MITLIFQCESKNKTPVTISGDWFQIVYGKLRDSDNNCIAYRDVAGFWVLNGRQYSDIVIAIN